MPVYISSLPLARMTIVPGRHFAAGALLQLSRQNEILRDCRQVSSESLILRVDVLAVNISPSLSAPLVLTGLLRALSQCSPQAALLYIVAPAKLEFADSEPALYDSRP